MAHVSPITMGDHSFPSNAMQPCAPKSADLLSMQHGEEVPDSNPKATIMQWVTTCPCTADPVTEICPLYRVDARSRDREPPVSSRTGGTLVIVLHQGRGSRTQQSNPRLSSCLYSARSVLVLGCAVDRPTANSRLHYSKSPGFQAKLFNLQVPYVLVLVLGLPRF
jgi:hypothetical protein